MEKNNRLLYPIKKYLRQGCLLLFILLGLSSFLPSVFPEINSSVSATLHSIYEFKKTSSDWKILLGAWNKQAPVPLPIAPKKTKGHQYVVVRNDMSEGTQWSHVSIDVKFKETNSKTSAGFVLNAKDDKEFGVLRIDKLLSIQLYERQFGYNHSLINDKMKRAIKYDKWYRLEIKKTSDLNKLFPWIIKLINIRTKTVLFKKNVENIMPFFGCGVVGLFTKNSNVKFRNFHITKEPSVGGQLQLAPLFTDKMVLQRDMQIPIWGRAKPESEVKVTIGNSSYKTITDSEGKWKVITDSMKVSKSLELKVSTESNKITINNIAIGEVWLASGQSNMQMQVWQSNVNKLSERLPADAEVRMFKQPQWPSETPVFDSGGEWINANADNVKDWSAVAYSFAVELRKKLEIPIGIIGSYSGGTPAESWIPAQYLKSNSMLRPIYERYKHSEKNFRSGEPIKYPRSAPGQKFGPEALFNGMIYPHIPYAIRGVIWYQGESNAKRAEQYRALFPALIRSWRKEWSRPSMEFLFVQLPGYDGRASGNDIEYAWSQLRDAQRKTLEAVDHTAMAITIDLGDSTNLHPTKKKEVGSRLARLALHDEYQYKNLVRGGPLFKNIEFYNDYAIITFIDTAKGLQIRNNNSLQGFVIAGKKREFTKAKAVILPGGNKVKVWCKKISEPIAVRYAWANNPTNANLVNSADLPASPFRTDNWGLATDGNY